METVRLLLIYLLELRSVWETLKGRRDRSDKGMDYERNARSSESSERQNRPKSR